MQYPQVRYTCYYATISEPALLIVSSDNDYSMYHIIIIIQYVIHSIAALPKYNMKLSEFSNQAEHKGRHACKKFLYSNLNYPNTCGHAVSN